MSQVNASSAAQFAVNAALPIPAAVAGGAAQQRIASAGVLNQAQSEQAAELILSELTAKALGDLGDPEATGDRDADGRMPWQAPQDQSSRGQAGPAAAAPGETSEASDEKPPHLDFLA